MTVQVYYESLCPDSIRFIKNQLMPTYEKLGNYFDVEFVPYGKASVIRDILGSGSGTMADTVSSKLGDRGFISS